MELPKFTERQKDVIAMLKRRYTIPQVARALRITVACLRVHMAHIRQRTGGIIPGQRTPGECRKAGDVLTPRQREVYDIRTKFGRPYKWIAFRMGITAGTARNAFLAAKRIMAQRVAANTAGAQAPAPAAPATPDADADAPGMEDPFFRLPSDGPND